ncbi:MAG: CvpA family protein [Clostridia bacterium]|nr:CvpA family protein [Clostridia bacterium]
MILDIACGAILIVFGLIGLFRGFAKQIYGVLSIFIGFIGAYLLLMPVYNLLYDLFLKGVVDGLAGLLAPLTFLDSYAAEFGKTTATLFAEWAMLLVLYVVLFIVVSLVWKFFKIFFKICDLPVIKVFDRIFGLILGLAFGVILVGAVLLLWTSALNWTFIPEGVTTAMADALAFISDGGFAVKPFILDHMDVVSGFFGQIWDLICKGYSAVTAA